MTTALSGLRVLDFSWGLAGAITTMVLADNGADVLKVEPPTGDPQRAMPAFAQWHRGKRSLVVDLKTEAGQDDARRLAAEADVLVQSWRPGVAERLGLGYEQLVPSCPGLVYCSITGFGPRGPLAGVRGYEAVVAAKAGLLAYQDRPRYSAIAGGSFSASQAALQGILAALYVHGRTGVGQKVETSLVQGLTGFDLYQWLGPQLKGELAEQPRAGSTFLSIMGLVAFTGDGAWLQFANFRPHLAAAFLEAIGLADWHRQALERKEPASVINEVVLRRLHEKTLDEWMEIFLRSDDIGMEPYRTPAEAMDHPQMLHNGHVLDVVDPVAGKTRQVGPLVALAATPAAPRAGAPILGQHGSDGFAPRPAAPPRSGPLPAAPLAGVTVLELAWFYAAPFGTALLADLGARVIKVEGADGDPHRYQSPLREFSGVKALQGKESIVVDYRTPDGKEILHKLVARSDIVMRNYRQQNSMATGDDYESLRQVNPDQVYLYAAAYGADGPYATRPAFAPTMGVAAGHRAYQLGWSQALAGLGVLTFDEGMELLAAQRKNSGGPTANADAAAAMVVGTAQLLGLVARERTGLGQYAQTTMLCSNAYVVSDGFFGFEGEGPAGHRDENGVSARYRLYPTGAGWVFLAAPLPSDWPALRDALALDDPRFATEDDRQANDSALVEAIGSALLARSAADWEAALAERDVTCVEVSTGSFSEFNISSPTVVENDFTAEVTHPLFGTHLRHGPVATLSATPGAPGPGCLVGQHTLPILSELGYTDEEIDALLEQRIVHSPERPPSG
ncbi:MAG TPA: CoA transferase [Acidimicrobiales bacterium]|jgi:crotonobetainyl-CoA:carnitine CoA-transferase CaiB-like acyl-CoA transferase